MTARDAGAGLRSIAGRVAIVTGAASGMGRAVAELFAAEGAKVALVDRAAEALESAVRDIVASGGIGRGHVVDVADAAAIDACVAAVRAELGPIDILVNNAGVPVGAVLEQPDYEDAWSRAFAVNIDAPMRFVRACLDDLVRNGDGRIVNVASTEGLGATPRTGPYTASKTALVGFTRSLAVDLGRRGVTANCICPGPINTGMTRSIPDDSKTTFAKRRVPVGRYGEPAEVAHIVLSLVLPAASYLTGAIIPVDGGMTASSR
jgi:3-oxoacyl-[acyl-carrier protein] reductase